MNMTAMMRIAGVLGIILLLPMAALAGGNSAYSALRVARQNSGAEKLLEMKGERGEPQPPAWVLVFSDPSARGGIREFTVAGGAVTEQRTPLHGYEQVAGDPPVALPRLNMDSEAAFQVANRQAIEKKVGFNWIDYTLRTNAATGAPMWVLRMYNSMGAPVGMMQISAENGSGIKPLEPMVAANPSAPPKQAPAPSKPVGGVIGTVKGTVERTANTVKNATLRTVGTVQEVLTGERTIGPKDDDE